MPHIRTRDGHDLYVRIVGRGEPCLLVHGFASDSRSWLPFIAPFAHRRRFIIPDLRGFGLSHHVPLEQGCALTQFAEDLEDVLAAYQVIQTPVVGISMGALTTAQSFQSFGGARFSRYLHIDQAPVIFNRDGATLGLLGDGQPAFFQRLQDLLDALSDGHMHKQYDQLPRALRAEFWAVFAQFASAAFTPKPVQALLRGAARSETLMRRLLPVQRWQVYLNVVRAYLERDYDLRPGFRAMQVPLTVLIGGSSAMYPPAGQRIIGELAPHARVREIAGAGHMLPYEAPRVFMRELNTFLFT